MRAEYMYALPCQLIDLAVRGEPTHQRWSPACVCKIPNHQLYSRFQTIRTICPLLVGSSEPHRHLHSLARELMLMLKNVCRSCSSSPPIRACCCGCSKMTWSPTFHRASRCGQATATRLKALHQGNPHTLGAQAQVMLHSRKLS